MGFVLFLRKKGDRRNMKKHIALLLSAVMCLGMLAGCGFGKTAETTNTPAASTTTEAPATETAAPATETPAAVHSPFLSARSRMPALLQYLLAESPSVVCLLDAV